MQADLASIRLEAGAPLLGVEVPLVPDALSGLRRHGPGGRHGVLDRVAGDQHRSPYAVGVQRRRNSGGSPAPVVTSQRKARHPQRVREIDHVLPQGRLFRHAWRGRVAEPCRTVAAQIRHQRPVACPDEPRHHLVVGADIVRKPVQQNDGKSGRGATIFVGDRQDVGIDAQSRRTGRLRERGGSRPPCHRSGSRDVP